MLEESGREVDHASGSVLASEGADVEVGLSSGDLVHEVGEVSPAVFEGLLWVLLLLHDPGQALQLLGELVTYGRMAASEGDGKSAEGHVGGLELEEVDFNEGEVEKEVIMG